MSNEKFQIQSEQYQFPYHYLVDLQEKTFGKTLDWGLDYFTYMGKVRDLVKKYIKKDILDIGCGDGFLLNNLGRDPEIGSKIQATGIDLDEKPIKFAQAFAHELPNVTFLSQDIGTYHQTSPLITVIETFEHIPDAVLPAFTGHIDRLLEPGGVLIISVPSKARPVIPKHYRHYDLQMLRDYFPQYQMLEVHYVTARTRLLYQIIALLLSNRRINLNTGLARRVLLYLHRRHTSDVDARHGAHIVLVLQKP